MQTIAWHQDKEKEVNSQSLGTSPAISGLCSPTFYSPSLQSERRGSVLTTLKSGRSSAHSSSRCCPWSHKLKVEKKKKGIFHIAIFHQSLISCKLFPIHPLWILKTHMGHCCLAFHYLFALSSSFAPKDRQKFHTVWLILPLISWDELFLVFWFGIWRKEAQRRVLSIVAARGTDNYNFLSLALLGKVNVALRT